MDVRAPTFASWPTLALCVLLCLWLSAPATARIGEARTLLAEGAQLRCVQPDEDTAECDYRLTQPAEVPEIRARLGEVELPVTDFLAFPQPGATAAVLFLIDTSDPNRNAAVRAGITHIRRMINAGGPHHTFGIATFDSDLKLVAELGSPRSQLDAALASIRASGRTTELYRNTLAAVELLGDHNAERKKLVLLSDGLAEDRAYYHADVVAAALKKGVSIDGLGYPRSVSLSVALQRLRRLADETGGTFVEANRGFALTDSYLEAPFASLDNGGSFLVELTPAIDAGATGNAAIELAVLAANRSFRVELPVALPAPPPPTPIFVSAPAPVPVPVPALPPAPTVDTGTLSPSVTGDVSATLPPDPLADSTTRQQLTGAAGGPSSETTATDNTGAEASAAGAGNSTPTLQTTAPTLRPQLPAPAPRLQPVYVGPIRFDSEQTMQMWLWIAIATLTLLMVGLLWTLVGLIRRRKVSKSGLEHTGPVKQFAQPEPAETFAYLEGAGGDGQRYPINSAEFRIGRHEDNELPLDDASISRHHAQIHRKRDGSFSISDLDSMNGVFVNDKRVSASPLQEGDLVELGDVQLRFTMLSTGPMAGDETVVVRTIAPDKFGTAA